MAAEDPDTAPDESGAMMAGEAEETTDLEPAVSGASVTPDNPDAVLSALGLLQPDTIAAAMHDRSASGLALVGAWAGSPDGCALIDQGVYDGFAVFTPTSIRMFEEVCTFAPPEAGASSYMLDATCSAEGETHPATLSITMENSQLMKLVMAEGTSGFDLLRCHLPD
jgi:hypothetical protein